jgi:hypothetical protein
MMAVEKNETVNRKKTCWSDAAACSHSPLFATPSFDFEVSIVGYDSFICYLKCTRMLFARGTL